MAKKIAEKRKKRSGSYLKLQKAQQDEQKKQNKKTQRIQESYESRIEELRWQATPQMIMQELDSQTDVNVYEEYDVFVSRAWEDNLFPIGNRFGFVVPGAKWIKQKLFTCFELIVAGF